MASDAPRSDPETQVIKNDELWMEDGNIVLIAETTSFCVHRGVLSGYSVVFKDLFSIPQPPQAEAEMIEGLPVVHLPDAAEDLANFLDLLYFGIRYLYPVPRYSYVVLIKATIL